jgi:hypothetical protein
MAAIAVVAASFAVWRIPWPLIRLSALFTLVVFILLTATLASILLRRAAWIGFTLFGWSWLFLSFLALSVGIWISSANPMPVPLPITSIWLMELQSSVLGRARPVQGEAVAVIPNLQGGHSLVPYAQFQIYNIWSSLLAACIGGLLARWFDAISPRSSPGGSGDKRE